MRIHAVGGLCNRVRAILSYRAAHGPISVVWQTDESVSHAHFLDVFEPLAGVTWIPPDSGCPAEVWDHAPGAPEGWKTSYAELRPLPDIGRRVLDLQQSLPRTSYCAVHIRRTDYLPNCITIGEPAAPVSEWIDWAIEQGLPCFVATDNSQTQRTMADAWFRFVSTHLPPGQEDRQTQERYGSLSDAVVDLFMCVGAVAFKGSRHSSFTDTINILRGLR